MTRRSFLSLFSVAVTAAATPLIALAARTRPRRPSPPPRPQPPRIPRPHLSPYANWQRIIRNEIQGIVIPPDLVYGWDQPVSVTYYKHFWVMKRRSTESPTIE